MTPPPEPESLSFTALADARRSLNEDVQRHRASVNYFASDAGFFRTAAEVEGAADPEAAADVPDLKALSAEEALRGVTTAVTCFESLDTALLDPATSDPARFAGLSEVDQKRLRTFADNATGRTKDWKSEGAARRYCIVRGVAPLLRLCDVEDLAPIENAVDWVWKQVTSEPAKEAIFEVALARPHAQPGDEAPPEDPWADDDDSRRRYPPNAFLTYWGLLSIARLPDVAATHGRAVDQAKLWLRSVVGRECAYVLSGSSARDPQQLAWALTGVVATDTVPLADRPSETTSLVRAGLSAFFGQQRPDGTWETGRALFHYPEAGNAYCYIYETLAELVSLAIDPRAKYHTEMRQLLRPYHGHLLRAHEALRATARRLGNDAGVGWSSGHHPHRTSPESWATATAYRFLQSLRRLIGIEVRDRAAQALQARRARKGLDDLKMMGRTWDAGKGCAGDLLAALFVHPTAAIVQPDGPHDPDRPQLSREWARSALLYGPPGTGKTTLAEAVAGALNWDFVEITPADFLDRGMELVSARADEIFRLLMELDRAVVLFDEIDELVRRRDGGGAGQAPAADMVGRFFTTTMLPRLARLWGGRRLIFFANTNSLVSVDPAVRRSQRFDATILVMPPSLQKRVQILGDAAEHVDAAAIAELLAHEDAAPGDNPGKKRFGWFPFLSFDQLQVLKNAQLTDPNDFLSLVEDLGEEIATDWQIPDREDTDDPEELMKKLIRAYQREGRLQRLDPRRLRLVRMPQDGDPPADVISSIDLEGAPAGYARWTGDKSPGDVMDGAGRLRPG